MELQKSTRILRSLVTVLAGAATFAMVVVPMPADAATTAPVNVSSATSAPLKMQSVQAAGDYWTAAKMASAKSADLLVPSAPKSAAVGTAAVAAAPAAAQPVTVTPTAGSVAAPANSATLATGSVARPYNNLPDRLNGKVFFTDGSTNYVCSGTVVNSANKDMVDTAGHCVSNGAGRFFTNWIFVPGYSSTATGCTTTAGCFPYGKWTARQLTTRAEWHNYANFKQDLGYAVLNTLGGQHIANLLGGQGSKFNLPRNQIFSAFGYPQAAPFNGSDQTACLSGWLADDSPSTRSGPLTVRISCNMTGGSSGGGWLVNMAASGLGYVNSHNSYKYMTGSLANATTMYGTYYGAEALSLFKSAQAL